MTLQYKDITIFYTDKGKGKTIVLLHGFLENSSMWADFTPTLCQTHRVICIDLLGHGKTQCLGYIHSMELMAEIVEKTLEKLEIKKSIIIGHSMGGYVALAFAEKNPSMVSGLCLINSTTQADSFERQQNRERAIFAVKTNHERFIKMAILNLFTLKNQEFFSKDIQYLTKEALQTPLQGIIASLEGMKIRKNRTHLFLKIPCKKLVILSKKDTVLDYKTTITQLKNTDINISELPDGHMSYIENKKELLKIIMDFTTNI